MSENQTTRSRKELLEFASSSSNSRATVRATTIVLHWVYNMHTKVRQRWRVGLTERESNVLQRQTHAHTSRELKALFNVFCFTESQHSGTHSIHQTFETGARSRKTLRIHCIERRLIEVLVSWVSAHSTGAHNNSAMVCNISVCFCFSFHPWWLYRCMV